MAGHRSVSLVGASARPKSFVAMSKLAQFNASVPSNDERRSSLSALSKDLEQDDTLANSEGLGDATDAPSTTIFMATSGPLKAPSLVNPHRLRLSPNADAAAGVVSVPASVPKVRLHAVLSKRHAH